jgi:hypothetical protein
MARMFGELLGLPPRARHCDEVSFPAAKAALRALQLRSTQDVNVLALEDGDIPCSSSHTTLGVWGSSFNGGSHQCSNECG